MAILVLPLGIFHNVEVDNLAGAHAACRIPPAGVAVHVVVDEALFEPRRPMAPVLFQEQAEEGGRQLPAAVRDPTRALQFAHDGVDDRHA